MSKVTTKPQLTVPKAIADQYGIRPGDELEWVPAGETIRFDVRGAEDWRAQAHNSRTMAVRWAHLQRQ